MKLITHIKNQKKFYIIVFIYFLCTIVRYMLKIELFDNIIGSFYFNLFFGIVGVYGFFNQLCSKKEKPVKINDINKAIEEARILKEKNDRLEQQSTF